MVAGFFLCGFLNRRVVVAGRVGTVGLGRLAAKTEAAMVFGSHHDDGFSLYSELSATATRANSAVDSSASIV